MRAIGIAIAVFLAVLVTGVGYLWAFNPPTQAPPGGSGAIAVDSANRVGIGTNSPGGILEVYAPTDSPWPLTLRNGAATNFWSIYPRTGGGLDFYERYNAGGYDNRMTIKGGGNVGIGTVAPDTKLDVNAGTTTAGAGGSNIATRLVGSTDVALRFQGGTTSSDIRAYSAGGFGFEVTDSEKVTITSAGNVGIGTTAPSKKIDVYGGAYSANNEHIRTSVTYNSVNRSAGIGVAGGGSNWGVNLFADGNKVFTADTNGGVMIGGSYVDSSAPANGAIIQGNVGIGTASPGRLLDVNGYSRFRNTAFFGTNDDVGLISWGTMGGGNGFGLRAEVGRALSFGANGTWDSVVISQGGNVGIGTANPGAKLDVNGGILGSGNNGSELYSLALRRSGAAGSLTAPDIYGNLAGGTLSLAGDSAGGGNVTIAGNVGIETTAINSSPPNAVAVGNLDANDIYLRSRGVWTSQLVRQSLSVSTYVANRGTTDLGTHKLCAMTGFSIYERGLDTVNGGCDAQPGANNVWTVSIADNSDVAWCRFVCLDW